MFGLVWCLLHCSVSHETLWSLILLFSPICPPHLSIETHHAPSVVSVSRCMQRRRTPCCLVMVPVMCYQTPLPFTLLFLTFLTELSWRGELSRWKAAVDKLTMHTHDSKALFTYVHSQKTPTSWLWSHMCRPKSAK